MAERQIRAEPPFERDVVPARQPAFILKSGHETMLAYGVKGCLAEGPLSGLAERTSRHFADNADGPDVLLGVIAYDGEKSAHLIQPERALRVQGRHDLSTTPGLSARAAAPTVLSVRAEPSREHYGNAVARGLQAIAADPELKKIVLSRSLKVQAAGDFPIGELLRRMSTDESVAVFAAPLPAKGRSPRMLVGATPELLIEKRGSRIASHPLAGSARRRADPAGDREAGETLLASGKDRREHAFVVEAIMDCLTPYCVELHTGNGVGLRATASMWHLGTRIEGRLKDPAMPSEALAALLHPTPAVCGLPRHKAHAINGALEGYDRDYYAGAVGWCDAGGDGKWFVSIRCAEVEGPEARLFAGAGIVPGSTPEGEIAETAAKFRAMLDAFGIAGGRIGEGEL